MSNPLTIHNCYCKVTYIKRCSEQENRKSIHSLLILYMFGSPLG